MCHSGVDVKTGTVPVKISKNGDKYSILTNHGDEVITDCLIWAVGRSPNINSVGLENVGVELTEKGYMAVRYRETSVKNIFSVGDVTGHIELTPVAIAAGRKLAARLFDGKTGLKQDYTNVPTVVFSHLLLSEVCGV